MTVQKILNEIFDWLIILVGYGIVAYCLLGIFYPDLVKLF